MELELKTPRVFAPLLAPAPYKGIHGGRGGGKSHFFAELLIERCLMHPGTRWACIREVQKSLEQSVKRLLEDKIAQYKLASHFDVRKVDIGTPGGGIIIFHGMQSHNADSIKSLEGFDGCWVEEAHTLSDTSLQMLRPTLRKDGAERWFSWNPRRAIDPVDKMFRGDESPTGAVCVQANWHDNPMFPAELEKERLDCMRMSPDQYRHIWEGDYVTVQAGAYFARQLLDARTEGRIGRVSADPLMTYRAFVDIGGTGRHADAFAMWICQFVGREVRVLDYYEAVHQPLASHVTWMRSRGYTPDKCQIWLPHDGDTNDKVHDVSYASSLREAGYFVEVIPNQGAGAARARIEAVRRLFPSIWFHDENTEAGRAALGWYHEIKDERRDVGLGPDHDWSSHAADAFGLMAIAYDAPQANPMKPIRYRSAVV